MAAQLASQRSPSKDTIGDDSKESSPPPTIQKTSGLSGANLKSKLSGAYKKAAGRDSKESAVYIPQDEDSDY
jgi:hypothetical protein